ncbi:MAG TPA: BON domain-containing protein [Vicinamibacterales bacterium]|nr:BON domain-containing protein [Vicinamibacterales bacterium]
MLQRTDADIAHGAIQAFELRGTVPYNVQIVAHNGHITLTGKVGRLFHKTEAEKAVRHVKGVRGVFNDIEVSSGEFARDVRHRIVEALHRNADVDARHIAVSVTGGVATLTGTVQTWVQRDSAEFAAASAPGISRVDNRVVIEPPAAAIDEMRRSRVLMATRAESLVKRQR